MSASSWTNQRRGVWSRDQVSTNPSSPLDVHLVSALLVQGPDEVLAAVLLGAGHVGRAGDHLSQFTISAQYLVYSQVTMIWIRMGWGICSILLVLCQQEEFENWTCSSGLFFKEA